MRGVLTGTPSHAEALVEWTHGQAANDNRDTRGDVRGEIREFLTTRRARISPEQAGLPAYGGDRRRVSGLRREEVALLAGISSEYYTRLERGNATGVSDSVIDGIAHALQLDEAERTHLLDLLRTAGTTRPPRRRPARQRVRPTVQRVLDSMIGTPAFVLNGRLDILAANQLGFALFSPIYADPVTAAQQRPVRLPRPARDRVLPRLGQGRQRHRRPAARRGRPRPLRPAAVRPDRGAVHPQRRVPASDGPPTTSGSTPPASSSSTTRSSGTSTWPSSPSRWPPTPARASSPTPPSPDRPPRTP